MCLASLYSNQLGLVFVAVYRTAFALTYVDDLLDSVCASFEGVFRGANQAIKYGQ